MDLRARFADTARRLGATGDPAPLGETLLRAWSEPGRVYHDLTHLRDVLAELDRVPVEALERARLEAALWFHDAVYDPRADDNEERSAAWAVAALPPLGVSPANTAEIARLVRLTRHDHVPDDPAGRLLCDVDLAVLGRPPEGFGAYEAAVRAEYGWLDEERWRAGRRQVLEALLARRPIYGTDGFRARYETAARRNLQAALDRLGEGNR